MFFRLRHKNLLARGRPLSALEKQRYQTYFSAQLLYQVRVVEEGTKQADGRLATVPFWLFKHMHGIVLGHIIYFRKDAYQAETQAGIELLAHELTHVQQFFDGMTITKYLWQSRNGYRNNPYEREAYANGARISYALNSLDKELMG